MRSALALPHAASNLTLKVSSHYAYQSARGVFYADTTSVPTDHETFFLSTGKMPFGGILLFMTQAAHGLFLQRALFFGGVGFGGKRVPVMEEQKACAVSQTW